MMANPFAPTILSTIGLDPVVDVTLAGTLERRV